ncbi:hypothetical protein Tco_0251746, partial [Tanacetum coccineum]
GNIYEALNVKVNDKPYSVRVFEEQFVASSLISPTTLSSDDDRSAFEEELVGPSLFGGGVQLPTEKPILSSPNNLRMGACFNGKKENISNIHNVELHMSSSNASINSPVKTSPITSHSGLSNNMDGVDRLNFMKSTFVPINET